MYSRMCARSRNPARAVYRMPPLVSSASPSRSIQGPDRCTPRSAGPAALYSVNRPGKGSDPYRIRGSGEGHDDAATTPAASNPTAATS
jgi:hypothetical protein